MQKRFTFFPLIQTVLLFLFFPATAQFHYVPATIWKINGDSLQGWVEESGLQTHPGWVRFRKELKNGENSFLTPAVISGFRTEKGNTYISYIGEVDSSHVFVVPEPSQIHPRRITNALFLKTVVEGKACLYYGKDHAGVSHFFMNKGRDQVHELQYYSIRWSKPGTDIGIFVKTFYFQLDKKIYLQQMLTAFTDCGNIYINLAKSNVHYTKRNLTKWFSLYNEQPCAGHNLNLPELRSEQQINK